MKIPPDLRDDLADKAAQGLTTRQIAAWLLDEHKIKVSHVAVASVLRKTGKARAAVAGAVVRRFAEENLPKDLQRLQRACDQNLELLEQAQARALQAPTFAQIESVCKLTAVVLKADEHRRKALGLDQPESKSHAEFEGIGELLGLNFKNDHEGPTREGGEGGPS